MKLTGSPVGETVADAVAGKLPRAGSGEDKVTLDAGVDNLNDDLLVCEADDQAVLGGVAAKRNISITSSLCAKERHILLVLRLGDQPLTGIVCRDVRTARDAADKRRCSQSVLPSLRRRYLTWKREKYAPDLTFLTKGICEVIRSAQ